MEEERGVLQVECSRAVHAQTFHDDNRLQAADERIACDDDAVGDHCVPGVSPECDMLLHTTLQCKHQFILHQLWIRLLVAWRCQLDKHPEAVATAHLQVVDH